MSAKPSCSLPWAGLDPDLAVATVLVFWELILKSLTCCFTVVRLQLENAKLGTAHLLKERVFLTGLPPCQQGSEPGQAGDFSKLEQIFFPCEDLPWLAESLSLNNRKGNPWFLFISLGACRTEGGTKLGLCLLKVHVCQILLSPLGYVAPCWVSCFTGACSSDFTAPLSTSSCLSWWIMRASGWQIKWRDFCVFGHGDELINLLSLFSPPAVCSLAVLNGCGAGVHRGDVWCIVQIAPACTDCSAAMGAMVGMG